MGKSLSKRVISLSVFALVLFSGAANAVCQPNNCYNEYYDCLESGSGAARCYVTYVQCLRSYGCQIP